MENQEMFTIDPAEDYNPSPDNGYIQDSTYNSHDHESASNDGFIHDVLVETTKDFVVEGIKGGVSIIADLLTGVFSSAAPSTSSYSSSTFEHDEEQG